MPDLRPHIHPVEVNYRSSVYIQIRFTAISSDVSSTVKLNVSKSNAKASGFLIPGAQHVGLF